jgi:hypothetical protein
MPLLFKINYYFVCMRFYHFIPILSLLNNHQQGPKKKFSSDQKEKENR